MFETMRFEAEQRVLGSLVLGAGLAAFAAMLSLIAPGLLGEVDLAALADQLPPAFVTAFDLAQMGTMEGFLAIELYQFLWLIGLGAYVAYNAGGTVAGDVETGRMDTLLAAPISRERLLVEKYLALLTPILITNLAVFAAVFVATRAVSEPIATVDLVAVHALSVPYFCCCGAFGMLASVTAPGRTIAEGIGAGGVVGTFLLETISRASDLSWVGSVAPMRYYDPTAILTASEYDLPGALILLAASVVMLAGSALWFREVDIS